MTPKIRLSPNASNASRPASSSPLISASTKKMSSWQSIYAGLQHRATPPPLVAPQGEGACGRRTSFNGSRGEAYALGAREGSGRRSAAPTSRRCSRGKRRRLDARLDLACRLAVADGNAARLQALRDIAHEVDIEEAVLEVGTLHLDVVGELEAPLDRAGGDAAVQELALLVIGLLLGADAEHLLLDVDMDLVLAEAGHRHGDPVLVVGEPLDVVGRIGGRAGVEAGHGVEQVEEPVEAN